ncbi:MAG: sugar phosphate isomerase/epimerase [Candidatus Omnitrophica bacterium]|nr:sugar phosphate isomerase/epimerase [Candidatus Omnitrophota bacterium]MCM8770976.1 sugar phosphate isomerase/epimerase [Candidatus Omnitrophota bacterium]
MCLALSTAWNSGHCLTAREIIDEIKELGFRAVELNFSLEAAIVDEISKLVDDKEIKVLSVHNYCPIPDGLSKEKALPDYYSLSSLNEEERQKAVYYTKKTIDTAKRVRARVVILHCGRNEITDHTRKLIGLYQKGLKDSEAFGQLKEQMHQEREKVAALHFECILKSLKELTKYAQEKDVLLGIENRFYYREIPSLEEIGIILEEFKNQGVYYWHDFGHSRIFENLGLVGNGEYLNLYADKLIGVHIHNVLNCVDHQSPLQGEIDFKQFRPYLKKETLKVVESHFPLADANSLKESKYYLEEIFR